MNIEFDVYKQKLNEVRPALEALADSLNVEGLRRSGSDELPIQEETLSQLEALEEKINEYSG